MLSQREIKRRYFHLLMEVSTSNYYKIDLENRVNCYVCTCGHVTKTKDIDAGVTPFLHKCENCGQHAKSTFYNDIAPNQNPTQEWYRPTLEQTLKLRNNEAMIDHIMNGGLDIRNIKP